MNPSLSNLAQQNAELMARLAAVDAIGPLGWRPYRDATVSRR